MKIATTTLAFCLCALLALGCVMLYSASMPSNGSETVFKRQVLFCALGVVAALVSAMIDYRWLKKFSYWIYAGILGLLVAVLIPGIGSHINGSWRWINLGPVGFQPSEVAKLGMIITLAAYLEHRQRKVDTFRHGILMPGLLTAPVLALLLLEPDLGSTALVGATCVALMVVAGVRLLYIGLPLALGVTALVIVITLIPNRLTRIDAYLHPEKYADTIAYQSLQSERAIRSGGPLGRGLGQSEVKNSRLPYHDRDFIFAVVGEELGLAGTATVAVVFLGLMLSGTFIAMHAKDTFGMLLAYGIVFIIVLQAFIHMGVGTHLLPNKGFPLPLISAGGSNVMFNMAGIGLLFSIARFGSVKRRSTNPFRAEVEVPTAQHI